MKNNISIAMLISLLFFQCDHKNVFETDRFCEIIELVNEKYPLEESEGVIYIGNTINYQPIYGYNLSRKYLIDTLCSAFSDNKFILINGSEWVKSKKMDAYYYYYISITEDGKYSMTRDYRSGILNETFFEPIIKEEEFTLYHKWGRWHITKEKSWIEEMLYIERPQR